MVPAEACFDTCLDLHNGQEDSMRNMIFPIITEDISKLPFYVASIGAGKSQEPVSRPEGYPSYHFLYTISGKGKLAIEGSDYVISENMGFFFYPGVPHEYYALTAPWSTCWLTFEGHGIQKLLNVMKIDKHKVFNITDLQLLERMHRDIYDAASSDYPSKGYECSSSLYKFLLGLRNCTNLWDSEQRPGNYKKLQPLLAFIETNYCTPLALEDMSKFIGVTPQHLCRLFRKTFNMRPFEYLTRFRLQKAKEILAGPDNPLLAKVASLTGFNDVSYFCAIFKEHEGMTPVEFRKMHKKT